MPPSSIRFTRRWREFALPTGGSIFRPFLSVLVHGQRSLLARNFLVDSGADLCMAPRRLCQQIGLRWEDGMPIPLQGITSRKACTVEGRIHVVELVVVEANLIISVPMVFARGNVPFVLGREGFFDAFAVTFDKTNRQTVFELVGS